MKKLVLNNPSTFFSKDAPVLILDKNKKLFYFHPNKERAITFNLPVGTFYTKNILSRKDFQPYEIYIQPNYKFNPSEFTITVGNNHHKATISPFNKNILVDKKIVNLKFQPAIQFLLGHEVKHLDIGGNQYDEMGRLIFDAEKECDAHAKNWMLSHGYNPIQIQLAVEVLKLNSGDRKHCIHEATQNFRR